MPKNNIIYIGYKQGLLTASYFKGLDRVGADLG
jgi:hypothetical protein